VIILILTIFNYLTVLRPGNGTKQVQDKVAILIPMRNEARNVAGVIASALGQERISNFEVKVIDDGSTDDTREQLSAITDSRFSWERGGALPAGWLGKNYALHQLAQEASGNYLVFVDADVRLSSGSIADSINLMEHRNLDYICPYPRQIAKTPLEVLLQPLLQWSWFASLPLLFVERSLRASTVVANGQFFIVKESAYRAIGGHEAIKTEVLDDMELARALRRSGFRGTVVDGSRIAYCRMYESGSELISGYLKSQWRAFGNTFGAALGVVLLSVSSLFPVALALFGSKTGLISLILVLISRLLVAQRVRASLISSIFHPVAISIWIYLIIRSILDKRTGKLNWRGRPI
jgi:glycosyltransferase involved in cell wall biosynthesis